MNMKPNRSHLIQLITIMVILPFGIMLVGRYHDKNITIILVSIVFWIIALKVMITSWLDYRTNLKLQKHHFDSMEKCYVFVSNITSRAVAYLETIAVEALLLALIVSLYFVSKAALFLSYVAPACVVVILVFMLFVLLELVNYLTSHICMSDKGIIIESVVRQPFPWSISWEEVTKVDIQCSTALPTNIKKVVVYGHQDNHKVRPIVIPGNHPDIHRIIQDIHGYVPNRFNTS